MTLKINRSPLLCYIKLCASFHSHWWIHTGVTVRKCPIGVKIGDFLSHVTLKIDKWPWRTIGYIFYATSSFVHHFADSDEFKLELQPGNLPFGWKSEFFVACDLEIWRMTLKNNRTPLLCYCKLCESFHSHQWIQTGVRVRKRPIRVKIGDFLSRVSVTLKFDGSPWKTKGHLSYATSIFFASFHRHMWIQIGVSPFSISPFVIAVTSHGCHDVSNHRQQLFRAKNKKTSKSSTLVSLCEGKPPVTDGFPSQDASNWVNKPQETTIKR